VVKEIVKDIIAGGALVLIAVGCWWIHPAAALIVVGGILLVGIVQPWKG